MERNCTSTIVVKYEADTKITAEVCYTHYGHEKELQHIRLPKEKRQELAAKLKHGVPKDRILSDIRESVSEDTLSRQHLLERKDLSNIQKAFGLKDFQRHPNDLESVLAWLTEWKSHPDANPVLLHKMQGEILEGYDLAQDDFVMIIQSPFQKSMLKKLGPNGVCCDSTHGTNGYDFLLTTLLVIDEFGEGFPVAWCITNHEDFTTMCTFFRQVKKNSGTISSSWFMSDIAAQFYNAWVGVMDDCPRPQKLLCTWHVDRAITTELRKKIGDKPTEGEVYKMFRTVLEQTNETLFDECLQGFLNRVSLSAKTASFKTYFERDWVPRKQQWAYCFRVGLGINTNMFVEAFHHVFKYNYLKGKTNKRMDNLLLNLMKFVRDKTFDRLIKLTKGKITMRLNMIHERHLRSLTIPTSAVTAEGPTSWRVLGEDGRSVYNVSRLLETCSDKHNCQLQCQECCICVHMYVCNCPDSLITTTICKHIHLVHRCSISPGEQSENHAQQWCEEGTDEGETTGKTHRAQQGKEHIAEKFAEMEFLKECLKNAPNNDGEMDREKRKRSLRAKLLTIVNDIEGCENDNALQQLEKNINSANSLFISIREHEHGNKHLPMPKPNIPHNKNIEAQKRFFSTKKKPRKSNVRLVKPTKEEKIEITKNWQAGNADQSGTDEQFLTGDTIKEGG